jgi:integrase
MATRKKKKARRPKGTGCIRAVRGRYCVTVYLPGVSAEGKRRTKSVTCDTMEEATKASRTLQREVDNGALVADDKLVVNDLLDRYLQAKKISKEATTHAWYERHFRTHIRPVIGTIHLADLKAAHIQSLLSNAKNLSRTAKKGEPLGGTSLRNLLVGIKAALAWGVRQGLLVRNVALVVEPPRIAHSEPVVVGLDHVRAIIAAAEGTELEAVVPFQIGTGLRRSETCGLRYGDIDFEAGTVRVQRGAANLRGEVIIKATKTKKSRRTEYLAPFVIAVLRKHRAAQAARYLALGLGKPGPDSPVFDRADGRAWDPNEMSRIFSRLVRAHKLPAIRLHDLRHSFATLSFAAGVPLKTVSESLGHSSVGITSAVYVHLLSQTKRDATDAFEAYVGPAATPLPKAVSQS